MTDKTSRKRPKMLFAADNFFLSTSPNPSRNRRSPSRPSPSHHRHPSPSRSRHRRRSRNCRSRNNNRRRNRNFQNRICRIRQNTRRCSRVRCSNRRSFRAAAGLHILRGTSPHNCRRNSTRCRNVTEPAQLVYCFRFLIMFAHN